LNATRTRTPCIGICSTTSVGDAICRGCKRYAFEVIRWNGYSEVEKEAVLSRIEALTVQILAGKFAIVSEQELAAALKQCKLPFNPSLSPFSWLHNYLKKGNLVVSAEQLGISVQPAYSHYSLEQLAALVDEELLVLCEAHFARYYQQVNSLA